LWKTPFFCPAVIANRASTKFAAEILSKGKITNVFGIWISKEHRSKHNFDNFYNLSSGMGIL
jgi:hypothetical protein